MPDKIQYTPVDDDTAKVLKKHFVTKFRSGYVKCKGTVLPEYFETFGDAIKNMDIRPDDIWVCSFPKSGTTWTQEMVWCIANDLNFKAAEQFLPERFPFLEHSPLFDYRDLVDKNPEITFPDYVMNSVDYINKMPSPRFIKAHLPFNLLPDKLQNFSTTAKIVYVARNPKDTCISYYHHCKLLEGYTGNFEEFCELFLKGSLCFAPFWNHVFSYWNQRSNPNVLILKYEEMKKDLKSEIVRTATFLKKTLPEQGLFELLEHLSFENMKKNRAVNYEPVIEINKNYKLIAEDGVFMRCGQVGEWKESMDSVMCKCFKQWLDDNIKDTDLSFETD